MSKIKSVVVTTIVFLMLAIITAASFEIYKPGFVIVVGCMASVGFASCAIAFCRWLQKPTERKEEPFVPVEVYQPEEDFDFQRVWDEVKREEMEGAARA